MAKNDVYPTHTCFDDTVEMMADILKENPKQFPYIRIVHGICLMPESGKKYAHAWVEVKDEVYFMGIIQKKRATIVVDKQEFYKSMEVQEWTAYTIPEALINEKLYGLPPYKPEYRALTGSSRHKERRKN